MIRFCKFYLTWAAILFITEILIGAYMHDAYIRPYGGDVLVVILIYCFIKSFFNTPTLYTAGGALIFSFLIELSQYFNLVSILGLEQYSLARTVMGTYFSVVDLFCYVVGIVIVILLEKNNIKHELTTNHHE